MSQQAVRAALVAIVMALAVGCGSDDGLGVAPPVYVTVKDRAAFDQTRLEVDHIFREAAVMVDETLDGGGLRSGTTVSDTLCGQLYPRRFSVLEAGTTLRAPGDSLSSAEQKVARAWKRRGWDADVTEPGRVMMSTSTSTRVRVVVAADLQVNTTEPASIGVGLSVTTRCLKLPKAVTERLR
jgi:hypothetical protein